MPSRAPTLLSVGRDQDLLRSRCAVLSSYGYDVKSATVAEAEVLLRTEEFDLVIMSAFLSKLEEDHLISAAGWTPTLIFKD